MARFTVPVAPSGLITGVVLPGARSYCCGSTADIADCECEDTRPSTTNPDREPIASVTRLVMSESAPRKPGGFALLPPRYCKPSGPNARFARSRGGDAAHYAAMGWPGQAPVRART